MSDIVLRNVAPPKEDDILSVDIYSDGKARCYSWSDKWIDAEVIDSKPMTNADRIRTMSDEELTEEIVKCRNADIFRRDVLGSWMFSTDEWLDWLKQEASHG